jgi:hypothetical protein
VYVDNTANIYIQGDRVTAERLSGQVVRDAGSIYSQPLPRAEVSNFQVRLAQGRGDVELIEQPSQSNGYRAALRVEDDDSGADLYHIVLTWDRGSQYGSYTDPYGAQRGPYTYDDPYYEDPRDRRRARRERKQDRWESADRMNNQQGYTPGAGRVLATTGNNPSAYDNRRQGVMSFRGRVSGTSLLVIEGDRVEEFTQSGNPLQVDSINFSQPLPAERIDNLRVQREQGRGRVQVMERPWSGNNYRAVLRITDEGRGSDYYSFDLVWRR